MNTAPLLAPFAWVRKPPGSAKVSDLVGAVRTIAIGSVDRERHEADRHLRGGHASGR